MWENHLHECFVLYKFANIDGGQGSEPKQAAVEVHGAAPPWELTPDFASGSGGCLGLLLSVTSNRSMADVNKKAAIFLVILVALIKLGVLMSVITGLTVVFWSVIEEMTPRQYPHLNYFLH